jgi:hypothetical protein|tara:strand:- start:369 stop:611 length:243 start_codon:yes stop_codon:yes gene_type:complete
MNKSYGLFNKEQFDFFGGYLTYDLQNGERNVFIARFKYNKSVKGRFVTFLKNNFTVSEYLGYLETGMTPVAVLLSKGFKF